MDYGVDRSEKYGHSRFGHTYHQGEVSFSSSFVSYVSWQTLCRMFVSMFLTALPVIDTPGHYPDWDSKHPIHFVGHSTGAQVVRVLQNMLADKVSSQMSSSIKSCTLSPSNIEQSNVYLRLSC